MDIMNEIELVFENNKYVIINENGKNVLNVDKLN